MTPIVVRKYWLEEEAKEAILEIQDGALFVEVFCHPCALTAGDSVKEPLHALDCRGIERDDFGTTPVFEGQPRGMGQRVRGTVESLERRLVRVGTIIVKLDMPFPGDLGVGDRVKFECERLDVVT
jgi:hypothetical protein